MEYIKIGSKILIILNVLVIVTAIIYVYKRDYWGYSYISMNDKKGIASKCYVAEKGLYCKNGKHFISVKQFGKR